MATVKKRGLNELIANMEEGFQTTPPDRHPISSDYQAAHLIAKHTDNILSHSQGWLNGVEGRWDVRKWIK